MDNGPQRFGEPGARRWTAGFSFFGEVIIVGALVAALALPLVTLLPALTAGVGHLRRHLGGERVRVVDALRDFAAAWRGMWRLALGFTGAALLLLWNLSLGQAGAVPASGGVVAVSAVLLLAWVVLLLRTAAAWRPPPAPGGVALVRGAARLLGRDPAGSVLLAFACAMCAVFVWMLLPLLLVTGGLLALATVAVEARRAAPPGGPGPPAG